MFREYILDIIIQFKIKVNGNINLNKKKSVLLDFYIKRIGDDNIDLIKNDDFNKIKILYEEVEFPNINKKYCEDDNGDIDILDSEDE